MSSAECEMYPWIEDALVHAAIKFGKGKNGRTNYITHDDGKEIRISRKPKVAQVLGLGGVGLTENANDTYPPYLIIHDGKVQATLFLSTFLATDSVIHNVPKGALIRVVDWTVNTVLRCAGPQTTAKYSTSPRRRSLRSHDAAHRSETAEQSDNTSSSLTLPFCLSVAAPLEVLSKNGMEMKGKLTDMNSCESILKTNRHFQFVEKKLVDVHEFLLNHANPKQSSHLSPYTAYTNSNNAHIPAEHHFDKTQLLNPNPIIQRFNSYYQCNRNTEFISHRFHCMILQSFAAAAATAASIHKVRQSGCNEKYPRLVKKRAELKVLQNIAATLIISKANLLQKELAKYKDEIIALYQMATTHAVTCSIGKIWWHYAVFTWSKAQDLDSANEIFLRALVSVRPTSNVDLNRLEDDSSSTSTPRKSLRVLANARKGHSTPEVRTRGIVETTDECYNKLWKEFLKFRREYKSDSSLTYFDLKEYYNAIGPVDIDNNDENTDNKKPSANTSDDISASKEVTAEKSTEHVSYSGTKKSDKDTERARTPSRSQAEGSGNKISLSPSKKSTEKNSGTKQSRVEELEVCEGFGNSAVENDSEIGTSKTQTPRNNHAIVESKGGETPNSKNSNAGITSKKNSVQNQNGSAPTSLSRDVAASDKSVEEPTQKLAQEVGNTKDGKTNKPSSPHKKPNGKTSKLAQTQPVDSVNGDNRNIDSKRQGNERSKGTSGSSTSYHNALSTTNGGSKNGNNEHTNSRRSPRLDKSKGKPAPAAMESKNDSSNLKSTELSSSPKSSSAISEGDGNISAPRPSQSSAGETTKCATDVSNKTCVEEPQKKSTLIIIDDSDDDSIVEQTGSTKAILSGLNRAVGPGDARKKPSVTNDGHSKDNEKKDEEGVRDEEENEEEAVLSSAADTGGEDFKRISLPHGDENASFHEEGTSANDAILDETMEHSEDYGPISSHSTPYAHGVVHEDGTPFYSGNESVLMDYCLEISIDGFTKNPLMLTISPDGRERMTVGKFARDVVEKYLAGDCLIPLCQSVLKGKDRKIVGSGDGAARVASIFYGDGYCSKFYLMNDEKHASSNDPPPEEDEDAVLHLSLCFALPYQSPYCAPTSLFFSQLQQFVSRQPEAENEHSHPIQVILKTDGPSWVTCPMDSSDYSDNDSEMDSAGRNERKAMKKNRKRKRKRLLKKKRRAWEIYSYRNRPSVIRKIKLLKKHDLFASDSERESEKQHKEKKRKS